MEKTFTNYCALIVSELFYVILEQLYSAEVWTPDFSNIFSPEKNESFSFR